MNLEGCRKLDRRPLSGHWFRAIELMYFRSRLSTEHTRITRSRFSPATSTKPRHRILYLAENHQVAMYEVGVLLGPPTAPIADPTASWLILSLEVRLCRVVDLCDEEQRAVVGTTFQELTGVWESFATIAPTQALGMALYRVPKLEGALYPSSKPSGGKALLVFPDKLDPRRSSLVFRNDLSREMERLR